MRYDWLVFDLDGTLLDYAAAEATALDATLVDAGLTADDETRAAYRRINAGHWARLEQGTTTAAALRVARWRDLLDELGHDGVDPGVVAQGYIGHLSAGAQLLDGALEAVADLADDHRIAVLTNGLADVQHPRLLASGIRRHAEVVVVSDEVGVAKPDAAIFEEAFVRMGDPDRRRVLMIGDSLASDIAGGVGFGLDTVWVAPADAPDPTDPLPTHRVASVVELAAWVRATPLMA